MAIATQGTASNYLQRAPSPSGLADVVELILDKGLVIDAYVRIAVIGIELITIDARIVIASVDTYLRFAEAVNRLDRRRRSSPACRSSPRRGRRRRPRARLRESRTRLRRTAPACERPPRGRPPRRRSERRQWRRGSSHREWAETTKAVTPETRDDPWAKSRRPLLRKPAGGVFSRNCRAQPPRRHSRL